MLKLKKLMAQRGFTLVELLIVIAVIGILAIAVLAALDPVQQLKKSRDTGKLADARELLNAYSRFYAAKGCYPADFSTGTNKCLNSQTVISGANTSDSAGGVPTDISLMVEENELKAQYSNKVNVQNGWLFVGITDNGTNSVCFPAESDNARNGGLNGTWTMSPTTGEIDPVAVPASSLCSNPYTADALATSCMVCVQ